MAVCKGMTGLVASSGEPACVTMAGPNCWTMTSRADAWFPMLMLYHEQDEDPALRPKPIALEQREKIIASMAVGLGEAYRYFRQRRKHKVATRGTTPRRTQGKIGRNDPCPCGSGKKYKRCCGGATIH